MDLLVSQRECEAKRGVGGRCEGTVFAALHLNRETNPSRLAQQLEATKKRDQHETDALSLRQRILMK